MTLKKITQYIVDNSEYTIVVFMFAGLITFNKVFAYIGVHNIYITEYICVLCLLSLSVKFIASNTFSNFKISKNSINSLIFQFWPLILITLYSLVRLYLNFDYGFLAVRHSMIFFYTVLFLLLFTLSVKDEKQLFFIFMVLLIILSTIFNGSKIIIYKLLNYSLNYFEQERVYHNEADTICASISLLGLLVYNKLFWNKSKTGYIIFIVLNVCILFLTVKRSAALGIIPPLLIYFLITQKKVNRKSIISIILAFIIITITSILIWYLIDQKSLTHLTNYFLSKLSLNENNTIWRFEAWKTGWQKFTEAPLFGIGYGPQIIETPIRGVDTNDPHNSFLAFLIRHGVIVFMLYLFFIFRTYVYIFKEIKVNQKNSINYNNAVFICLGLSMLIIFASFNVMLENQYEGIFFYFFLSAIYIVNAQKTGKFSIRQYKIFNYISYITLAMVAIFVLLSFSPFNQIQSIPIYSAKTNSRLPIIYKGSTNKINPSLSKVRNIISQKDVGIFLNNDNSSIFTDLLWIFPAQARKLNYNEYSLYIESNACLKKISCFIQYEDNRRIPLEKKCSDTITTIRLTNLNYNLSKIIKINYIVLSIPGFTDLNNLIIKNIYLSRKRK